MDKEFAKVIDNIDDIIKEYENEKINYKRVNKFCDLCKYSNLLQSYVSVYNRYKDNIEAIQNTLTKIDITIMNGDELTN